MKGDMPASAAKSRTVKGSGVWENEKADTAGAKNGQIVKESKSNGVKGKIDEFFLISRRGSSLKTEFFAGLATFLAMAYILVVNPAMLLGGDQTKWVSVFLATVFGAAVGTVLMAILAKLPYAQAPGMGLNTVAGALIGGYGAYTYNFNTAMLIILISGLIFMALSLIPSGRDKKTNKLRALREDVFLGVPRSIRAAIPVGIGFFVAFVGFQNANIVNASEHTLTHFVSFTDWSNPLIVKNAIVCFVGLIFIAILASFKIKGSVILGIICSTVLAMILGIVDWATLKGQGAVSWKFWENLSNYVSFSDKGAFFAPFYDIEISGGIWPFIMTIITFTMVDMFDTMGTMVGCATHAKLVDEEGKPVGYSDIIHADSIATVCGAMLGTSTVTTYVESSEGIDAGGKTGFTSIVVAGFFLLALFFAPLFAFIPAAATAPALIYVGLHMIGSLKKIDFTDIRNGVPAFFAIVIMPISYSITDGIGVAILSYVLISIAIYLINLIKYALKREGAKKPEWDISIVTIIIAVLFCVFFFVPTTLG